MEFWSQRGKPSSAKMERTRRHGCAGGPLNRCCPNPFCTHFSYICPQFHTQVCDFSAHRLIHRCIQHADWGSSVALGVAFSQEVETVDKHHTFVASCDNWSMLYSVISRLVSHTSNHLIMIKFIMATLLLFPTPFQWTTILKDVLLKSVIPR